MTTMEFGKGFGSYYSGWNDWVKEYPEADREAYPALFELPEVRQRHFLTVTLALAI